MTERPARKVDEKTMLSAAEVASFRRQFKVNRIALAASRAIASGARCAVYSAKGLARATPGVAAMLL